MFRMAYDYDVYGLPITKEELHLVVQTLVNIRKYDEKLSEEKGDKILELAIRFDKFYKYLDRFGTPLKSLKPQYGPRWYEGPPIK